MRISDEAHISDLRLKDRAILLLSRREYEGALILWRKVVQRRPNDPTERVNLANALYHCGEHREAREILEVLIDESPEWAIPWHLIAQVRQALADEDVALEAARTAVSLDENVLTRTGLAEILSAQGDAGAAAEEFERALEMASDEGERSMIRGGYGMTLVSLGQPHKAVEILKPLAESDHQRAPDACIQSGLAYYQIWRRSDRSDRAAANECRAAFWRASMLDGANPLCWHGVGMAEAELGNHDAAIAFLDRGKALGGRPAFSDHWRAMSLVNVGRLDEAIESALASNDDGWDSPIANLATVAIAIASAGFTGHEDLMNDLRDHVADAPQIANACAVHELQRGDADAAQVLVDEATALWPNDTVLRRNAITIAAVRRDLGSVTSHFPRLEATDAELATEWAPEIGAALASGDALELKAALNPIGEAAFASHHPRRDDQDSWPLGMLTNAVSVRFEEQVAERLKTDHGYRETAVSWKPAFLDGKEIDIWATGAGKSAVVSCKLRLGPGKPLAKSEIQSLVTKRAVVRRECGATSEAIAGLVVTNEAKADADAIALASREDVELLQATLSRGFPQDPRWTVVRLSPIGP